MPSLKPPKPKPPLEKDIQRAVIQFLQYKGVLVWRQNSMGRFFKDRWIPTAAIRGMADVFALSKGVLWSIEIKRPGGKLSPEQETWARLVMAHGGVAITAFSVADVQRLFK